MGLKTTKSKATKKTFKQRLSRLSFAQACRLLGSEGEKLLRAGRSIPIDSDDVRLTARSFRAQVGGAQVRIMPNEGGRPALKVSCSSCDGDCEHKAAALALLLEHKLTLGLATAPEDKPVLGTLTDEQAVALALEERTQRAKSEPLAVSSEDKDELWTDYVVTNKSTGRSYRVALRGFEPGESYCSCPDFRKNTLGTCKHIIRVQHVVKHRFTAARRKQPYVRKSFAVHLLYGRNLELRLLRPGSIDAAARTVVDGLAQPIGDIPDLLMRIRRLQGLGYDVTVYPDAEEYIEAQLKKAHLTRLVDEIRANPADHPIRKTLLKTELLPYQLDGIAFAAGKGRAILADDMGLGKTIQGIGAAELLARQAGIERVLVVCPVSLKAQWRSEIERFSDRSARIVAGPTKERADEYGKAFFTIANYEQVVRDIDLVEKAPWDLVILDEAQRIKNWETRTAQTIKRLESPFALVLTGTPLENRIDDLYSIVEFIDERRLGPAFLFFNTHRVVDEKGRVIGYRDLDALRKKLGPVFLRRTRGGVLGELPPRTTEILYAEQKQEQFDIEQGQSQIIKTIINKPHMNEMDMLRLQRALLVSRLAANSSYLVHKEPPGASGKMELLEELLGRLAAEPNRKIVLFSEWTNMLDIIEPVLDRVGLGFVRLDGSVPQKERAGLVKRFEKNRDCRVFITTNAGSVGLNLQVANTVVNVDLPWNPAVLEQRIARAHRMGQKSSVQVYLLVTAGSIESRILGTLSGKHELSLAALDMDSEKDAVELLSGIEELKRRLEKLLGPPPDAEIHQGQKEEVSRQVRSRRERVAVAGGQLLTAAFSFIGEMLPEPESSEQHSLLKDQIKTGLEDCLTQGEDGRLRLSLELPDAASLESLAATLARMIPLRGAQQPGRAN